MKVQKLKKRESSRKNTASQGLRRRRFLPLEGRFLRALILTGGILLVLCLGEPLVNSLKDATEAKEQEVIPSITWDALWDEDSCRRRDAVLPDHFEEEVFPVEEYDEVYVSPGGSVVGFISGKSPKAAFDSCQNNMIARGWSMVVSGQENTASFLKKEGVYRWLSLSCVSAGKGTSIVVQGESHE